MDEKKNLNGVIIIALMILCDRNKGHPGLGYSKAN